MSLTVFHPSVQAWFDATLGTPTPVQARAWPAIRTGRHALIAAPTGSGKTLAAFLAAIDTLVGEGVVDGLADETTVLYVSPLRALSSDIQRNLQAPLAGIRDELAREGKPDVAIRAWVRSGDTPAGERERMRRRPPHILVTTPESLYILLTSASGRQMLSTVRTAIVDEIHAIAGSKRGSHLALSLQRLAALTQRPLQRIGLSATQKPIETVATFLTGGRDSCEIIDMGHVRDRDLALEVPDAPLAAVMANEIWEEIYDRLAELIGGHRTTLVFVNTRRQCERLARHLSERLGETAVTSHHGSLAREHRLDAERRLKNGELRALVATASLELGIDIGEVDLVCQLGSPRAIGTFLQRVGRSGHAVGRVSRGRLFPLSRDDLVECTALLDAVARSELDSLRIPEAPLDLLAQQIVAEVAAAGECDEAELYRVIIDTWPYRDLTRETFTEVVRMLADGYATRRGRRSAYLHRDAVNARLRPRRGARLAALTNGGAIADQFDYDVTLQPEGLRVGSVNEDFVFESLPGDVFQLGNIAYRIVKVESGRVFVENAKGASPNLPFWFGEAPGRSDELSAAVSRLRADIDKRLAEGGVEAAGGWLISQLRLPPAAAAQLATYLAVARAALGAVPTQEHLVIERFFDEVGDMHLVIHSPYGSRINRAWGLALRKRFCRRFNFELQAAALEDSIVLSLGPTHSFALDEVPRYLNSATAREVLVQALLDAPVFAARWRWNATLALALQRSRNGKRRPAQFQRQDAEDLVAVVFPDQLACAENLAGARELPDHPLVRQTLDDCLVETTDAAGMERLLSRIESGDVTVAVRDLTTASPLAEEVINARPYAFLDDGALEERRTLSIASGTPLDAIDGETLGRLDPEAIARVRAEVWPAPRDADELHDALVVLGFLTEGEAAEDWRPLFQSLVADRRATVVSVPSGETLWVSAERLAELRCLAPASSMQPALPVLGEQPADADVALVELVRSRLEGLGPVTAIALAAPLGISVPRVDAALAALEREGFVVQGRFTGTVEAVEWCERRLLARINRYTLRRRRAEIEPVSPQDYLRFLLDWHGLTDRPEGAEALADSLAQLEGFALPAAAWEAQVLPARSADYRPQLLDQLLATGRFAWLRLAPPRQGGVHKPGPLRHTPIALIERAGLAHWRRASASMGSESPSPELSSATQRVLQTLETDGAAFFDDLVAWTGLLRSQVEAALGELVAWGLASADTFNGLRALIAPAHKRPSLAPRGRRRRRSAPSVEAAGRWVRLAPPPAAKVESHRGMTDFATLEHIAWVLLRRYGVVFRKVLERESAIPPWRELLYVYHRLEARDAIRGGRFVDQFSGEQFAHPKALGALKAVRGRPKNASEIVVGAADPLNLAGILTPGNRLPAMNSNRVLYRDGLPVAWLINGEVQLAADAEPEERWRLRQRLQGRGQPAAGTVARLSGA